MKFDPLDHEIIWHLLAKSGVSGFQPHPFIDEFIPTVVKDDGICYTHPQKLPGTCTFMDYVLLKMFKFFTSLLPSFQRYKRSKGVFGCVFSSDYSYLSHKNQL